MKNVKNILMLVGLNILVSTLVFGAASWYVYDHRTSIFGNFANQYITDSSAAGKNNSSKSVDLNKVLGNKIMGGDLSVEGVVAKVNPAVVSIVASKDVPVIEQYFDNSSPFGDFFGMQIPQYRQNGTQKQEIGSGSGFFVSSDGLVVTNKHVVSDTQAEYTVITSDNKKYTATVLARDPFLDVAIVKIDKKDTPYLELGNSDQLKLGQSVIAIGNALGQFRNSISVGVVSGLSRSIVAGDGGSSENLDQVIQTDAAINPGNSGGPLLDLQGKVIGVNVAVAQGSENVGFALPISIVKGVVDSVKQYGSIFRPYLGIRYVQIDQALKDKNNLSVDYGVLIARGINPGELAVIPGSPADKAGLVENDIILSIDGQKLTSDGSQTLAYIIRQKKIGDSVTLRVLSKGQEKEVKLKLEKSPN